MLDYCIEKARKHDSKGRVTVYAVATDSKGRFIAEAGNSYVRASGYQAKLAKAVGLDSKQFLHAELAVLIQCMKKHVTPKTIYVARVRKDGTIANAKPCKICSLGLELAGVKNIVHT